MALENVIKACPATGACPAIYLSVELLAFATGTIRIRPLPSPALSTSAPFTCDRDSNEPGIRICSGTLGIKHNFYTREQGFMSSDSFKPVPPNEGPWSAQTHCTTSDTKTNRMPRASSRGVPSASAAIVAGCGWPMAIANPSRAASRAARSSCERIASRLALSSRNTLRDADRTPARSAASCGHRHDGRPAINEKQAAPAQCRH